MFRSLVYGIAAALLLLAGGAQATPIESISFSGTLGYGYDSKGVFGAANSQLGNSSYSIIFSFDPTGLTNDTCGTGSNNSCYWTFGAGVATEAVTINGITQIFAATSGNIQFCACSSDAIYINAYGANGLYFGGTFQDTNKLFKNHSNVNDPTLLLDFVNVALVGGNWSSSGLGTDHNTSFGLTPTAISATYSSGLLAAPVSVRAPEPVTLSLFGAGLVGVGALRRRRAAKA